MFKDVLRLKLDAKLSHEQIAGSLGLSKGVVAKYVGLAAAGLEEQLTQAGMAAIPLSRSTTIRPNAIFACQSSNKKSLGAFAPRTA